MGGYFHHRTLFILSSAALALSGIAPASALDRQPLAVEERVRVTKPDRKRRSAGLADSPTRWKRSRGRPPKRRLKRNLVTHSRRVRRKHRRARKAA